MPITLREITEDSRDAVLAVRTTPEQEQFVSTVAGSLEEAADHPEGKPWFRAVHDGGQAVGLVMLSWDVAPQPPDINGPWFLCKLLIDHRHQRCGHGREVVRQVVEIVREHGGTDLMTSYVPGDGSPGPFYAGWGFVPTGELDPDGEVLRRLAVADEGRSGE